MARRIFRGVLLAGLGMAAVSSFAQSEAAPRVIAYLGVAARPIEPALREHLNLPEGVGLTIAEVEPEGPAKDVLAPNDVLIRLDGQWLTDPVQLAAIVRLHKPGEEVEVEFLRRGARQQARIRLGERPWSPLPASLPRESRPLLSPLTPRMRGWDMPGAENDDVSELFRRFRRWLEEDEAAIPPAAGDIQVQASSTTVITEAYGGRTYRLTITDGQRSFEVKDADGKVLFQSEVNTEDQIRSIPDEYREAYERLSRRAEPGGLSPSFRIRTKPRGPVM